MKIIRYLLSNLILITFFCGIIYVYYYWDNLTGEDTPAGEAIAYLSKEFKGVESFIDGIKIKQGSDTGSSTATDGADDDGDAVVVVAAASANINSSTDSSTTKADTTTVASSGTSGTDATTVASNETDTSRDNNKVAAYEGTGRNTIKEGVFVTPEIEKSLNQAFDYPVNNQSSSSADDTQSLTKKEANRAFFIDARSAFYKRDYETSISNYKKLIANSTDNYDAYGEMGNVYFNQGKKTEAAAAYYEAASVLVKLGKQKQANSLIPLLNYLDTNKAEQLKELLNAGQS